MPAPEGAANLIDTDYQVGQDNYQARPLGVNIDIHGAVFAVSSLVILAFVVLTLALPEQATATLRRAKNWINYPRHLVLPAVGQRLRGAVPRPDRSRPWGEIRIGGANATPDFSRISWFSMLFAAGMGVGLMFYGVSEPLSHYGTSLGGTTVGEQGMRTDWAPLGGAAGDPQAATPAWAWPRLILHWSLHPWAIVCHRGAGPVPSSPTTRACP
ncbi:MAG: BCCT family transporter [Gammaproteobacteria bacterium]|nr:BCCT family transporter [Gammaproteobacteria bacterium]